jgi:hypothetical protein
VRFEGSNGKQPEGSPAKTPDGGSTADREINTGVFKCRLVTANGLTVNELLKDR